MSLNRKQLAAFKTLSGEITKSEQGFAFASEHDAALYEAEGLIEVNPSITDDNGNVAVRLVTTESTKTEAPVATTENKTMSEVKQHVAPIKSGFVIEDNVPLPAGSSRAGAGASIYPFDALAVGQSFFVPDSEDKPNAAKSLASTVSSANARYAVAVEGEVRLNRKGKEVAVTKQERQFIVRAVEGGARVWRTL